MNYFISAGEASGDLHAAAVIKALKSADPNARFTFLGGDLMAREAGCEPVVDYRRMAYMGFSEVLRHLPEIARNLKAAKRAIENSGCDCVILVDYPSFNLKLAKYARSRGIPVYYFIAPKVWAWKEWRVKQLRLYVDKILSILPFEVEYFRGKGVTVEYVGNPSQEEIDAAAARLRAQSDTFRSRMNLPQGKPLLALVPGSRRGEIRNNLPVMEEVAARHPELQAAVAAAPGIEKEYYSRYTTLPLVHDATFELMVNATAALVTSGTATLECALAGTPQVVCYRANAKKLSYNIMKHFIKVPYVSLPNLIAWQPVVPEMLVHLCTTDGVDCELSNILPGAPGREVQLRGYGEMRLRLGTNHAASRAAEIIISDLKLR